MSEKKGSWKCNVYALLAAVIWGSAFVAQGSAADFLPPFSFNAIRSAIAVAFLTVLLAFRTGFRRALKVRVPHRDWKKLILGGLCSGTAVFIAANLQQAGIPGAGAGKAAFLTALYVVLVPVLGLLIGRRMPVTVLAAVPIAVAGLYLLCVKESFVPAFSDALLILCAVTYAFHILILDYFTRYVDGIELSCLQFLFVGIFSAIAMLLTEHPTWEAVTQCALPLLYVGVFSSGVAYTLQILAQSGSNPTVVTILFSLESFFGILTESVVGFLGGNWVPRSAKEYIGCGAMMCAVLISQLPCRREIGRRKKRRSPYES